MCECCLVQGFITICELLEDCRKNATHVSIFRQSFKFNICVRHHAELQRPDGIIQQCLNGDRGIRHFGYLRCSLCLVYLHVVVAFHLSLRPSGLTSKQYEQHD
jgi:hypothetical protein